MQHEAVAVPLAGGRGRAAKEGRRRWRRARSMTTRAPRLALPLPSCSMSRRV